MTQTDQFGVKNVVWFRINQTNFEASCSCNHHIITISYTYNSRIKINHESTVIVNSEIKFELHLLLTLCKLFPNFGEEFQGTFPLVYISLLSENTIMQKIRTAIQRILRKLLKLNIWKTNNPIKNRPKTLVDTSPKIYKLKTK